MLSCCLKCNNKKKKKKKKNTEIINLKVSATSNGRIVVLSKCATGIKKS